MKWSIEYRAVIDTEPYMDCFIRVYQEGQTSWAYIAYDEWGEALESSECIWIEGIGFPSSDEAMRAAELALDELTHPATTCDEDR